MGKELHIAGIVVHARPERAQRVAEAIRGISGAEIHATSADGKLVVTLEAPGAREIAARMDEIQQFDAVLSASLVYQHNESLEAMMEEVSDGNDETGIH